MGGGTIPKSLLSAWIGSTQNPLGAQLACCFLEFPDLPAQLFARRHDAITAAAHCQNPRRHWRDLTAKHFPESRRPPNLLSKDGIASPLTCRLHLPSMPNRDSTTRDYRERINRVIFHIESHLADPVNLQELARIACFSPYHFHRIFAAFTGEPLASYIRRLRLERSTQQLRYLDVPVTDIALGAGYETPSAYTRAFTAHFGTSPTEFPQAARTRRHARSQTPRAHINHPGENDEPRDPHH